MKVLAETAPRMHEMPYVHTRHNTATTTDFSINNILREDFRPFGNRSSTSASSSTSSSSSSTSAKFIGSKMHQQRIRANARERGRVHTISAAFNSLRNSVPVSTDCKLSKVSVLRIAAAYIETLTACLEANPPQIEPEDLSSNSHLHHHHQQQPVVTFSCSSNQVREARARFNACSRRLNRRINNECQSDVRLL